jgi:hypothetical protein
MCYESMERNDRCNDDDDAAVLPNIHRWSLLVQKGPEIQQEHLYAGRMLVLHTISIGRVEYNH